MSKNHLANWVKMTVIGGGLNDITLGPVTGFPTAGSAVGTGKSFHYAFLNPNLSPIEIGQGVLTNATTLQRDAVEAAMIAGEMITDGSKADIPVGAVLFTAPTANALRELVLEGVLTDYGNVSGAFSASFKQACIRANLTADATLTVDAATLPPAGTHHEIVLKITSNDNPALTTPFQAGFVLTLAGTNFYVDGGQTAWPSMRLMGAGREMTLRLTNIGGGQNYRVENISKHEHIHNLGVVSGNVTLDIRRPWNIAELTGSDLTATINAISPDVAVLEPAHFTIVNNGSVSKTLFFNTNILTITGSTLSQLTIPIGFRVDLDVRRNPLNGAVSYEAKVGDVNYNQTASGLSTSLNPSDRHSSITLSASNTTFTPNVSVANGQTLSGTVRGFGGKATGKWVLAMQLLDTPSYTNPSGSSDNASVVYLGVTTGGQILSNFPGGNGSTGVSAAFRIRRWSTSNQERGIVAFDAAGVTSPVFSYLTPQGNLLGYVSGDILAMEFDLDSGSVKAFYNGVALSSGASVVSTVPGTIYYPALAYFGQRINASASTTILGSARLLDEVTYPYMHLHPDARYWTA